MLFACKRRNMVAKKSFSTISWIPEKNMAKNSISQIEFDEKKVINALQKNARGKIDKIAIDCGFSRQKVWRIIKRLEENKTIWGYHTVIDNEKLGLKRYFVLIKRTPKPLTKTMVDIITKRRIKKEIAKQGINLECSLYLEGDYDWIFCVTGDSIKQIKIFVESLHSLFRGYISDIKTLEVVFPLERNGFDNPNPEKIKEFFMTE